MPTDEILNLNSLLGLYGFPIPKDNEKTVKLVFHPTSQYDFVDDFQQNKIQKIEAYQREQGSHVFGKCTHIVSFLQDGASRALFFGIYRAVKFLKIRLPNFQAVLLTSNGVLVPIGTI